MLFQDGQVESNVYDEAVVRNSGPPETLVPQLAVCPWPRQFASLGLFPLSVKFPCWTRKL